MKRISEVLSWKFWIWLPVVGILLPLIFNLLPGDWVNVKLMVALFIVNMLFSIYVGNFLRRHGAFSILLIVWPVIFLISVWLGINSKMYGYYLALAYLVIELFAFTRGQEKEIDIEAQLPVDGGMQDL
ncbi:hypothetical protein [Weissella soli]|uniref:hypothetical protein n=1 Tax=Weissella soli TaxID=155866 RepID=UPI00359FCE12